MVHETFGQPFAQGLRNNRFGGEEDFGKLNQKTLVRNKFPTVAEKAFVSILKALISNDYSLI